MTLAPVAGVFMSISLSTFSEWNKKKYSIHTKNDTHHVFFKEREIWWCAIGQNIGYEQNGKHANFERPILILKKYNQHLFVGIPMTTKNREGKYYFQSEYRGKMYTAILSQLRAYSSKRLLRKIRVLPESEFKTMRKNIFELL